MVRQLITAKADVHCRNREGRRPIDVPWASRQGSQHVSRPATQVARSFFGGEVPMALSVALLADGGDDMEDSAQVNYVPHGVSRARKAVRLHNEG